ncbi:MAG: LPS assembly lipoprotein LptE [Bacteroidota bacterium]|nr:LPS assembly lipoprotein LptE [Bacteroidota bacterium]
MKSIQKINFMLLILAAFSFAGCGVYTQSGASIHPDAKTFSVAYIINNASIVAPTLSQTLTERIKTKFINETPLKLTNEIGDLHFSGKITAYVTAPIAIQGNQANALSRLTLTVEISCDNKLEEDKSFTQTFSNFTDFDSQLNFATIEKDLISKICDGLVQDIFNKAFINW